MSFWSNKPVKVVEDGVIEQLLSNESLYELISNDSTLQNFSIGVDYTVYQGGNLSSDKKNDLLTFINEHYKSRDETVSLMYTLDILDYFIDNESLVIEFSPKNSKKGGLQIGLIIGKISKLNVCNDIDKYLEVNFLCLNEKLRNLHASSFMINILTRECIKKYNVGIAHYTVGKLIKSPSFCTKRIFHRPLNINQLVQCDFFGKNGDYNIIDLINCFNTFPTQQYEQDLSYINGNIPLNYDEIFEKLIRFRKDNYKVYDILTKESLYKSFLNKGFHHFIFSKNNNVHAYFSIFDLKSINNGNKGTYTNGVIYKFFFSNNNVSKIVECIAKKCYDLGIFDSLTLMESFPYKFKNWMIGSGIQNYYIFNKAVPTMEPFDVALVTI
jgi:hypothetical protein